MSDEVTLQFIPWVRHALADAIDGTPDATTGRPSMDVTADVQVSYKDGSTTPKPGIGVSMSGYGPGDIKSLNSRYLKRLEPRRGTLDFEPNYIPFVEFSRPDLPWLFSPEAADQGAASLEGLRPWICLVVVPEGDGVSLSARTGSPNPVLELSSPFLDTDTQNVVPYGLPDLSQSNWWSHVQVSGQWDTSGDAQSTTDNFTQIVEQTPERVFARLLCPVDLDPETRYIACIVPTFKRGVQAGLGQDVDAGALDYAWDASSVPDPVSLPVYFSWRFRTGRAGDFESLARRLEAFEPTGGVGGATIQVDLAEFGLADTSDDPSIRFQNYQLDGALRIPAADPPSRSDIDSALRGAYETLLSPSYYPDVNDLVAPPRYGRWHAGRENVAPEQGRPWFEDLNVDPRHRGTASRGTKVVQDQQDRLMESAWKQVGDLQKLNQLHRWGQLSRQLGKSTHDRLTDHISSDYRKLHLLWPVLDRVNLDSGKTPLGELDDTDLPRGVFTAAFRRLLRSRGPMLKKRIAEAPGTYGPYVVEEDLSNCQLEPETLEDNINVFEQPEEYQYAAFPRFFIEGGEVEILERDPDAFLQLIDEMEGHYDSSEPAENEEPVRAAVLETTNRLAQDYLSAVEPAPSPSCSHNIPGWVAESEAKLDPELTVVDYLQSRGSVPPSLLGDDPLEEVIVAPEFPQPMYAPLADKFPDLLLPGIGEIPNNSVTALETNAHFIEAYMTGLNHEMSREFLWREYPCDLRGTYFEQFWDIRGVMPQPTTEAERDALKDIEEIHTWKTNSLGSNLKGAGAGGRTVLLLRGELLKRYPNAIVYAIEAIWDDHGDWHEEYYNFTGRAPSRAAWESPSPDPTILSTVEYPQFTGHIDPDIRFFGFDLTTDEAKGGTDQATDPPGWFFVIQQPPGLTRFGLDVPDWDAVSGRFITPASGHISSTDDGAQAAWSLYQKPYRIALHADELIA